MTMHMLGPKYSTNRTRKSRSKLTEQRKTRLDAEWHEHNRWLRQNHMANISFEEFQDYVRGKCPKPDTDRNSKLKHAVSPHDDRREAYKRIPSHGVKHSGGECARKESPKYTGDLVKGVATMHKSNAVPVIDEEHIRDIAHMRR